MKKNYPNAFKPLDAEEKKRMKQEKNLIPMSPSQGKKFLGDLQSATNGETKRIAVQVKLQPKTLNKIKQKAQEMDLSYQSLIRTVLHKYAME